MAVSYWQILLVETIHCKDRLFPVFCSVDAAISYVLSSPFNNGYLCLSASFPWKCKWWVGTMGLEQQLFIIPWYIYIFLSVNKILFIKSPSILDIYSLMHMSMKFLWCSLMCVSHLTWLLIRAAWLSFSISYCLTQLQFLLLSFHLRGLFVYRDSRWQWLNLKLTVSLS